MAKKRINWSTEKIMSTSALFISVISLIALLYQSYLAREDNKLTQKQQSASVLPYLQFENIYNVRAFSIHLVNKGVGPAFIKRVSFSINDSIQFDNSTSALLHLMKEKVSKGDSINYSGSMTITKNTVIQPSENIRVFEVSSKSNGDVSGVKNFKNHINKTPPSFSIVYEDVYGNQWELSNKENKNDFQFLTPSKVNE
ncbi:hypothetical protein [Winogradskyella sp.]|uniref:hypothetical protein n=1 Tax=Winogradskyella sp. TaxID=1883156 RepID=UPI003BACFE28